MMANVYKTYRCVNCGEFEILQSHKDILEVCPKCDCYVDRLLSKPIVAKDSAPRTVGSLIELNNKRNPLTREKKFGVDAEKKMKEKERLNKISKLSGDGLKKFIEKGTL